MGKRLFPTSIIPHQKGTSYTYKDLVECLKQGKDVHIRGDAGRRLGSSLGVDLKFFGGTGGSLKAGLIILDGSAGTRMGISMVSGAVYVKGRVEQPLGNVREALSLPNVLTGDCLLIKDSLVRDTIAARLDSDVRVIVEGDTGMNTGVLLEGGTLAVDNAGEFAGA